VTTAISAAVNDFATEQFTAREGLTALRERCVIFDEQGIWPRRAKSIALLPQCFQNFSRKKISKEKAH